MLNTKPIVKEPENAKQFELKEGGVKFENIKVNLELLTRNMT